MIRVLRRSESAWPATLNEGISPQVEALHLAGRFLDPHAPAIAVVGTRRPTAAGVEAAREIAGGLALAGYTIVSGLAVGVDAAAHRAAIDVGGHTVAVLGCGHDIDYPKRNRALRRAIEGSGTVLSEYEPNVEPKPWMFPLRNRIIAGLALATVVVEGTIRSGALVTARLALDANREVFAVPGSVRNVMAEGPNELVRRGEAALVTGSKDVIEALTGFLGEGPDQMEIPSLALSEVEERVLAHLDDVPDQVDGFVAALEVGPEEVASALSMLELKGYALRSFRGYIVTREGAQARRSVLSER
jgi:DNA processing protein